MMEITQEIKEEILKILASKDEAEEAMTRQEITEVLGWSEDKTDRLLKELKRRGFLEVKTVYREDIDGDISKRPGYVIKIN